MAHLTWPAELLTRLYNAAAKNAETVPNPVRISITYPREEITIVDSSGTCRTVSVPPCNIVLTSDQLTPVPVSDVLFDQPSSPGSSPNHHLAQPTTANLPSHDIAMSLEVDGSVQVHDYMHADGGFSLPPGDMIFATPKLGSINHDVRNASSQRLTCHECASASILCKNSAGFPCRGCVGRDVPCVVTFYPRALAGTSTGSDNSDTVDDQQPPQPCGAPAAVVN